MRNLPRSPTPHKDKCHSCMRSHPKTQCRATNTVCRNFGKKGHWRKTPRYPVLNFKCHLCGNKGRYDQCCLTFKYLSPEWEDEQDGRPHPSRPQG
ncbi:hypothetical protein E2C01_031461 [Portunus trituberculatus]|uniref:Uncharacterized protein n=1 Tax=Portunus trituberculatus TaxID=210409 RepID=A0A5B7F052_PORTR|nr:hypothetical protein [Portunus trituberculatus]